MTFPIFGRACFVAAVAAVVSVLISLLRYLWVPRISSEGFMQPVHTRG